MNTTATKNKIMEHLNHPYMQTLQGTLQIHYNLYEALNKRLSLIRNNYASKTEFEKNEVEITTIKTNSEIESLKKVILAREEYFKKYMQQFVVDVKETESNYEETLASAKQKQEKITGLKEVLENVKWETVAENIEVKIKLYQRLKKMLA